MEPVRLPNDGKTDRKVRMTLAGGALGTSVAVTSDIPQLAGDAVAEALNGNAGPALTTLATRGTTLVTTLLFQLLVGWATGYFARKGPMDG